MKDEHNMERDEKFMQIALDIAEKARENNEVPVGAIIVFENEIIATGKNSRECSQNSLGHAEIEAINCACRVLKSWRLINCELYVTLEPCPMCAGAIINSRISRLIYGAHDTKSGSCESVINLFEFPYNHKPQVIGGILQDKCSGILSDFFKNIRKEKQKKSSGTARMI